MTGPTVLDQLAFTGWSIVVHAAILVPLYGMVRLAQRGARWTR